MKRSLVAGLGFLALVAAMPASAADLPRGSMPYKAPAYVAQYNWTGFYLGINGGGAWGDSDWNGFAVSNSPSGGMIGGTAGYNWQGVGSPWVFGLEGDIDWTNIKDSAACGALNCETKNNWLGTVRGRVGYAFDRFLPYFTGGVAFGDIEANRTGFAGIEATPTSAGPSASASKASSPATGPPRSSISMPTSATRPAAPRLAARRPTSTCSSTSCAPV